MEVQVAFVCLMTTVLSQQSERMVKNYCVDNSNCTAHSTCKGNVCECSDGYQRDISRQCPHCPGPSSSCEDCCHAPSTKSDSFILAAQVALGAALTIAFLALTALLWKACKHHTGSRGHLSSLLREQESSLTSMQRNILQRLRDRPPRYEDTNQIQLEKPPPYQEAVTNSVVPDTWSTTPPLYCETLLSSTTITVTEENKPVQQANMSFVSDTRTRREGENRLQVEVTESGSCQLGGADNAGYTLHEARQTQHSETELYM